MATNQVFAPDRTRSLPVPTSTKSGDPVAVGAVPGTALTDAGDGGNANDHATIALGGQFTFAVTPSAALAVGDPVYIAGDGTLSDTNTDTLFGYAMATAAGGGTATIPVEVARV